MVADQGDALFAPPDLDLAPEVEALLTRLGLGAFDRSRLGTFPGRNDVWVGPTESGEVVVAKRLLGDDDHVRVRMARLLAFDEFRRRVKDDLAAPRLLGADRRHGVVVHEYVHGGRAAADLFVAETFDDDLACRVGRALGALHASDPTDLADLEPNPLPLPSAAAFVGIPSAVFEASSAAVLDAWRHLQNDAPLQEGIERLRARTADQPPVPSHGDVRIDQLVVTDGELFLVDWEEFGPADPARDVGAFAGEWLQRAVLDIVTSRGNSSFAEVQLSHEDVVRRGVANLERLRPRIRSFWCGYTGVAAEVDPDLAARATAVAGWHLFDRLIAGATRTARLSGIERAAAGVGRAALIEPDRFAPTIGLDLR